MSRLILRLLPSSALFACLMLAGVGQAFAAPRSATARIERVTTAVATLHDVRVDLAWPSGMPQGELRLQARLVDAPDLGYRFRDLDWRCPLLRDASGAWQCAGELRSGGERMRLSVELGVATTEASLVHGASRIELHRNATTPDATHIDLTRVPLAWTQALLSKAWEASRITGGTFDAALTITAATDEPIRVAGPLRIAAASFDTPDGTIAGANLGARLDVDARLGERDRFTIDGQLLGGEVLFGTTYVSLQERPVELHLSGLQDGQGWTLPRIGWNDRGILAVEGSAAIGPQAELRALDLQLHASDLAPMSAAYLSGWLGLAGLGDLAIGGAADATVRISDGELDDGLLRLHQVRLDDPRGRFAFNGIDGDLAFSGAAPVSSELRWQGGDLYGLAFGPSRLPFRSAAGVLQLADAVELSLLGGAARFDHLQIRPPGGDESMDVRFGLTLERLDVAQLSEALDWPAFTGELSGTIPEARYADDRVQFDGGLAMQLFGGEVEVTQLSMERPFGVLPTLSADVTFDDIDLAALTGAFDFGSISGKLDGRIADLRLVNWQPVAFDARLDTDRHSGVRQRISQRAVQDLTSVGNASIVGSLQSQLIGFFDDFGYSRIGIACRLSDEVCTMDGLGSAGEGFIIVEGSGLPRLTVVGYNRRVDWPTLVERLAAVGKGDVKPVVE
ncbi:hypothetical protein [Lysobacter sp. F6437]|uniref:hypothetical protein n=1 Tax=Lysobacter sp. F6437 TaxID=3459296 RepID=UPI00403D896C